MKKVLLVVISLIVGVILGIAFTINTMKVNIKAETETGALVQVVVLDNVFEYYCEK